MQKLTRFLRGRNKRGLRIIASMVSFMFVVLLINPLVANAATCTIVNKHNEKSMRYLKFGNTGKAIFFPTKYVKESGKVAYCLQHSKLSPDGLMYTTDGAGTVDAGVRYILGQKPNTGSTDEDYYIKQLALQYYLGQVPEVSKTSDSPIKRMILKYAEEAENHKNDPASPSIKISPNNNNFYYKDGGYETDWIQIKYPNNINSLQSKLIAPQGMELHVPGKTVGELPNGATKFYLRIPESKVTGNMDVKFGIRGNYSETPVQVFQPSHNNDYQKVAVPNGTKTYATNDAYFTAHLAIDYGKIKVVKVGENNNTLANAKFNLLKNGKVVASATTNSEGIAYFNNLVRGSYTVKEAQAPTGYQVNSSSFDVTVSDANTSTVNVSDKKIQGRIKVTKESQITHEKLAGATFNVINAATNKTVATITTDNSGSATTGLLDYGKYIIKETKAPAKYVLNGETHIATITNQNQVVSVTHTDKIIQGKIAIEKSDAQISDFKVANAEYSIYDANGKVVSKIVTDEKGYAESGLLNYGEYTMKETKAPTGYLLNNNVYKINITEEGKTYTYDVQDQVITGNIHVVKVDSETDKGLEGAIFGVYAKNVIGVKADTLVDTITSNKDGFAFTKTLRYGQYYIKELTAPKGYVLNTEPVNDSIVENNKTVVQYIKDTPIQAKIEVFKKDAENNKPLANVKFKIVNTDTKNEVKFTTFKGTKAIEQTEFTTNEDGEILTPQALKYGNYELVEVQTTKGYVLGGPIKFSINNSTNIKNIKLLGNVYTMNVTNERIVGNMKIQKISAETNKPLANAKFTIKGIEGFGKDKSWTVTSGNDGYASLNNLEYGVYEVTEIQAPTGYVLNKEPMRFSVLENGKTISLTMKDRAIVNPVEFAKVNLFNNEERSGAKIKLTCTDGLQKGKTIAFTSRVQPTTFRLEYGTWEFKELIAPLGFNKNSVKATVKVDKDGVHQTAIIKDKPIEGILEYSKQDLTTAKILNGAKFNVTCIEGLLKGQTWKLDTADSVQKLKLQFGTYEMKEVQAPTGYNLNNKPVQFVIMDEGAVSKANIKDTRITGKVYLTKSDITNGKNVAGAKISIKCIEGFQKGKVINITTEDKPVELNLEYGKYEYVETEAPTGYNLNKTVGSFEIKENGQIVKANITDERTTGSIDFSKVDVVNGKNVEGAKIKITALSGLDKGKVIEFTSTEKAQRFTLPIGEYEFTETTAPKGYNLNTNSVKFTILKDKVIKGELKDERTTGSIDFSKVDVVNGKNIEGAKIKITALSGLDKGKVIEFTSTEKAQRFTLPIGEYEFTETTAPKGYNLNTNSVKFTILKDKVIKGELKDTRTTGKVLVSKEDLTTGKNIAGAKIKIWGTTLLGEKVSYEYTTSNEPMEYALEAGSYHYQESVAPKGYELNTTATDFDITKEGQVVKCVVKDKLTTGTLIISKTDITNGKEVPGAKIKIWGTTVTGKKVEFTFVSKDKPTEFTLEAGSYQYQEVIAPKGYELNKTVGKFEISKEGQIAKCTVKDTPIKKILPKTGQDSQRPFLIFGLLSIICGSAIILLILRNRKNLKINK